jgi:hypothetical protein
LVVSSAFALITGTNVDTAIADEQNKANNFLLFIIIFSLSDFNSRISAHAAVRFSLRE